MEIKKRWIIDFIKDGGTPEDLKQVLRDELWNPGQFALWCEEYADGLTASDSTLPLHSALCTAAEEFRVLASKKG